MSARIRHQPGDGVLATGGVMDEDLFEVEELERAAEWRLRKVDADPIDAVSRDAAARLEMLAADVRRLRGSPLFRRVCRDLQLAWRVGRDCRFHGHGERLPRADRGGSFAGEWRGVSACADRAGEADVRRGVKRIVRTYEGDCLVASLLALTICCSSASVVIWRQ